MEQHYCWRIADRMITVDRPLVMGIVNVTPDSFSDGGKFFNPAAAIAHARRLADDGADILDIGGESTRPGAAIVEPDDELNRVIPAIEGIARSCAIPISVDTSKSAVARRAVAAGAHIINDVTGLAGDPEMEQVAAETGAGVVVMHMQGNPRTMQIDPQYPDGVMPAIQRYFQQRLQSLAAGGIGPERVVLDPGIGFGKRSAHNWELLARLGEFRPLARPICLGVSRKGLLGKLVDRPVQERDPVSLAVACFAIARCGPLIIRTHNVAATRDAIRVAERLGEFQCPGSSSSPGSLCSSPPG